MIARAQFGPRVHDDAVTFRVWAPKSRQVALLTDGAQAMRPSGDGWHELTLASAGAGTRYKFRLDDGLEVPDPASHYQPDDVAGASEVVDHAAFEWQARNWRGRPWQEAVFLECHVGTFTQAGTFRGAIERLDHLVDCGITALELMPVADFAGRWNWGYDGVLLYAPDSAYGRPEDLKSLVDAAHQRGLMVFLDVVYNHFGPEGNCLGRFAPQFFTAAHTPWGSAIDYRVPQVRAFAIENALHWLDHYRFDGLRLDAVHAITETGTPHLLAELSRAVGDFATASGRLIHLVLENDDNRATLLDPLQEPPDGSYRAQWNDDYHHAWHALLSGEDSGYYRDYANDARRHLVRALSSGFAYQGEASPHRGGQRRGEPSGTLSPLAFVSFLQNHDQIGNRPLGERLSRLADPRAVAAALAITLIAPMPPLLFMGDEWGSELPFPFFCDFHGDLAAAVRNGRRQEFSEAYARHGDEIPDPLSDTTVQAAKLDWDTRETGPGRERLALVRDLLRCRREQVTPFLADARFGEARFEGDVLRADWLLGPSRRLHLLANLGDRDQPAGVMAGRPIFGGQPAASLPPWSVHWSIGDA